MCGKSIRQQVGSEIEICFRSVSVSPSVGQIVGPECPCALDNGSAVYPHYDRAAAIGGGRTYVALKGVSTSIIQIPGLDALQQPKYVTEFHGVIILQCTQPTIKSLA